MKRTFLPIIIFSFFIPNINSQTNEIINPNKKWYFGAEVGTSIINLEKNDFSIQGGLLAEYYFSKKWSVSTKLKYFETGVSFSQEGSSGFFGTSSRFGTFKGKSIAIPLNVKWEFKIYRNLKANLKIGGVYNKELESNYYNYSSNLDFNTYKTEYFGSVFGLGFNYFMSNNSTVYIDLEIFGGTKKGTESTGISLYGSSGIIYNSSTQISFGYKYSFKKKKEIK